jgi:hypothetical protein
MWGVWPLQGIICSVLRGWGIEGWGRVGGNGGGGSMGEK